MPTFTAIALDRLLEPGSMAASKKKDPDPSRKLDRRNTAPSPAVSDDAVSSATRRLDIPPPRPQLRRRNTVSFAPPAPEKKAAAPARPQISPSLYATPEATPLPDSPTSSFSLTSPYLINHKRRGPRLSKSFSEQNVAAAEKKDDVTESKDVVNGGHARSLSDESVARETAKEERLEDELFNGNGLREVEVKEKEANGEAVAKEEVEVNDSVNGGSNGEGKVAAVSSSSEREWGGEMEDFFDPQESMSFTSNTDGECYSADQSARFFDASEELSSDSGRQPHRSHFDLEIELREMRTSLLMEIEKRKQAEEALNSMRNQWQLLREKLGIVGLSLPADFPASFEDSHSDVDPTEDICRQVHLARFVSESIGRGIAKAEAEAELEAQLETKNFEIARLCDRLHYYETMNKEMSQRNQEAIEIARCERQKRRRRQKWFWGSVAAAITLGSAALAWSYIPGGKGSSLPSSVEASDSDSNVQ